MDDLRNQPFFASSREISLDLAHILVDQMLANERAGQPGLIDLFEFTGRQATYCEMAAAWARDPLDLEVAILCANHWRALQMELY